MKKYYLEYKDSDNPRTELNINNYLTALPVAVGIMSYSVLSPSVNGGEPLNKIKMNSFDITEVEYNDDETVKNEHVMFRYRKQRFDVDGYLITPTKDE
jgi:hypothetical protein